MSLLKILAEYDSEVAGMPYRVSWPVMEGTLLNKIKKYLSSADTRSLKHILSDFLNEGNIEQVPSYIELKKWINLFSNETESKIIRLLYEHSFEHFSMSEIRGIFQSPESEQRGAWKHKPLRVINTGRLDSFYPRCIVQKLKDLWQRVGDDVEPKEAKEEPNDCSEESVYLSVDEATKTTWRAEQHSKRKGGSPVEKKRLTEWLESTADELRRIDNELRPTKIVKKVEASQVNPIISQASQTLNLNLTEEKLLVLTFTFLFTSHEKIAVSDSKTEKENAAVLLLCVAVAAGEFKLCEDLLKDYPDSINATLDVGKIKKRHSPLFVAVEKKRFKIFTMLLEKGADYLWTNGNGRPLLFTFQSALGFKLLLNYLLINKSPSTAVEDIQCLLELKVNNEISFIVYLFSDSKEYFSGFCEWIRDSNNRDLLAEVLFPFIKEEMLSDREKTLAMACFINRRESEYSRRRDIIIEHTLNVMREQNEVINENNSRNDRRVTTLFFAFIHANYPLAKLLIYSSKINLLSVRHSESNLTALEWAYQHLIFCCSPTVIGAIDFEMENMSLGPKVAKSSLEELFKFYQAVLAQQVNVEVKQLPWLSITLLRLLSSGAAYKKTNKWTSRVVFYERLSEDLESLLPFEPKYMSTIRCLVGAVQANTNINEFLKKLRAEQSESTKPRLVPFFKFIHEDQWLGTPGLPTLEEFRMRIKGGPYRCLIPICHQIYHELMPVQADAAKRQSDEDTNQEITITYLVLLCLFFNRKEEKAPLTRYIPAEWSKLIVYLDKMSSDKDKSETILYDVVMGCYIMKKPDFSFLEMLELNTKFFSKLIKQSPGSMFFKSKFSTTIKKVLDLLERYQHTQPQETRYKTIIGIVVK